MSPGARSMATDTVQFPSVKAVRAYVPKSSPSSLACACSPGAGCHDVIDAHWIHGHRTRMAHPLSAYERYARNLKAWGGLDALGKMVVRVEADDGTVGTGVSVGGEPGCFIVEKHLSRFIEGEDPRNVELLWDKMFRGTLSYGRKGLPLQAISAVDLALWDLLGRLRGEPVYALLGGSTRAGRGAGGEGGLPVYCTTARPDVAMQQGFAGAKVSCPYGPADGDRGLIKNVEFVRGWREKVGADFPLMLDCYMALSVPYTVRLVRQLEPLGLKWIEEYLQPDDYVGYGDVRELLRGSDVMLAAGEHEYLRYGFQQLLDARSLDVLQPDVTWMGGLTEARRVVAMAAARDVTVVPHGSSVYAYHLQYAFINCPVAEYINTSPNPDTIAPYLGDLFTDEPLPQRGFIVLDPSKPGCGVTLRSVDALYRPYPPRSAEESRVQGEENRRDWMPPGGERVATMPF